MKYFYRLGLFLGLMVQMLLRPAAAVAVPFTPGNIVVARVGDGTGSLTLAAAAVFLDEYAPGPGGTLILVQSVALPTAVSGNNRILTVSGTSNSELALARTANGRALVLAGYGAAPATPAVAATDASNVVRVVGLVGADGSVNTTTSLGNAFSSSNVRSVASVDGSNFYVVGNTTSASSAAGVEYIALGGFNPTQLTTVAPTNLRVVSIVNGNLYVSSMTGSFIGLSAVGTGLPTTAGQTVTLLPGSPGNVGASAQSPYGFYFADLSPTVAGVDVVYVVDSRPSSAPGGGIQKWSLVGGTWILNGTMSNSTTSQLTGIEGSVAGTSVSLFATSSVSIFTLTDNTGYNVAPVITVLPAAAVTLPTGSNKAFRGVSFAPAMPAPIITSFTPTSGFANGTVTVTVTGTDFTGATAVTLNGVVVAGYTVVNGTTITFVVPSGATSGAIAVTTATGTGTSTGTFTVIVPNPVPTITSLTPSTTVAGSAGFTLTVNGTGFISGTGVNFNGTALATTFVSATQLTAAVPASAVAMAGAYPVTATSPAPGGGTSAAATFTVTTPAPTITSFTPTSGGPGTSVTLTGTNLTGATSVRIGTFAVTNFTVVNATTITFVAPNGTGSVNGLISVTTPGGTATSTTPFNLVSATLAANALPGLVVFPNPAIDRLTVELPTSAPATVALRDLAGRLVLAPAALGADHQLLLPVSLASGVYLLEVRQGATVAIRRIEKN